MGLVAQVAVHNPAAPALRVQRLVVTTQTVSADMSFIAAAMLSPCANRPPSLCRSHRYLSRVAVHPCLHRGKYSSTPTHRVLPPHGAFHLEHTCSPATDLSRQAGSGFGKHPSPMLPCMGGLTHLPSAHMLHPPPNGLGGQSALLRDGHTFDRRIRAHNSRESMAIVV